MTCIKVGGIQLHNQYLTTAMYYSTICWICTGIYAHYSYTRAHTHKHMFMSILLCPYKREKKVCYQIVKCIFTTSSWSNIKTKEKSAQRTESVMPVSTHDIYTHPLLCMLLQQLHNNVTQKTGIGCSAVGACPLKHKPPHFPLGCTNPIQQ